MLSAKLTQPEVAQVLLRGSGPETRWPGALAWISTSKPSYRCIRSLSRREDVIMERLHRLAAIKHWQMAGAEQYRFFTPPLRPPVCLPQAASRDLADQIMLTGLLSDSPARHSLPASLRLPMICRRCNQCRATRDMRDHRAVGNHDEDPATGPAILHLQYPDRQGRYSEGQDNIQTVTSQTSWFCRGSIYGRPAMCYARLHASRCRMENSSLAPAAS
jgi:hypothetical protein